MPQRQHLYLAAAAYTHYQQCIAIDAPHKSRGFAALLRWILYIEPNMTDGYAWSEKQEAFMMDYKQGTNTQQQALVQFFETSQRVLEVRDAYTDLAEGQFKHKVMRLLQQHGREALTVNFFTETMQNGHEQA